MASPADSTGPRPSEADDGTAATRQRDPLLGTTLGEYTVLAQLGEGAMGVVYRGEQVMLGKPVAIKVLRGDATALSAQKLLQEARALSAARHPNIIDVVSFGTTPFGQQYFVMELLDGEALDEHLRARGGSVQVGEAVAILKQLVSALVAAHAAGVIHRDLKPANVFLAKLADGTRHVKLLDFGIAKRGAPNQAVRPTAQLVVGTPLYMPPEQARADEIGPWTDYYAVGCVAYELLTGSPPFTADTVLELMVKHASDEATPLAQRVPSLPKELSSLVMALLSKDVTKRPDGLALKLGLERVERRLAAASRTRGTGILIGPLVPPPASGTALPLPQATPPSAPPAMPGPARPALAVAVGAGLLVLLGVGGALALSTGAGPSSPSPAPPPPSGAQANRPDEPGPPEPAVALSAPGSAGLPGRDPAPAPSVAQSRAGPPRPPGARAPAQPAATGTRPVHTGPECATRIRSLQVRLRAERKDDPLARIALKDLDDVWATTMSGGDGDGCWREVSAIETTLRGP